MKAFLKYIVIIFMSVVCAFSVNAQSKKEKLYAAYINNFANYTTWPDETKIDSFRIVIISENPDIVSEFDNFSKKKKIKNKPISLTIEKTYIKGQVPHILFLTSDKLNVVSDIYNYIERKPVLLVTEDYKDQSNIMINLFKTEQGQILFEINKANIINQKLIIDPEILLAGGTEVDVAALYRSSQVSLRKLQKEKDIIADSIKILRKNIEAVVELIRNKQNEIIIQNEHIENTSQQLIEEEDKIKKGEKKLKTLNDSIKIKNAYLDKQAQEIKKQWDNLAEQENMLKAKQEQIETLNKKIQDKNKEIDTQLNVISRQKSTMFLLFIIITLVIMLGVSILINLIKNSQKRKKLAEQKKLIEENLQAVKELNEKLKMSDQYKSIFLASMSHELRTPLNSIIGYTGIILMGMTGELNDEQVKQLNKVKNNARHLLSLINDILDISKIEANRVDLDLSEFSVKDLIDEVVETLFPKAKEKQLNMTGKAPDNMMVLSDNRRLKQVVLNLATNAVNYTHTGHVSIEAIFLPDEKFRITVNDTGIGIPDDEMLKLFQPFHQIDASLTKKNSSGTGLGLYLCKKITNLLDGDIFVKSKVNSGSEFYIELPLKKN